MNFVVHHKGRARGTRTPTRSTLERFYPAVRYFVCLAAPLLRKRLTTYGTLIRFLSRVDPFVNLNVLRERK